MRMTLCFLAAFLATAAVHAGETEDEAAIRAIYHNWDAALAKHDANRVLADRTPDFVLVDVDGQSHDFAALKQATRGQLAQYAQTTGDTELIQVVVDSDRARITSKSRMKAWVLLPPETAAKAGVTAAPIDATAVSLDDWLRTAQGWQMARTRILVQNSVPDPAFVAQMKQRLAAQTQTAPGGGPLTYQQTLQYGAMRNCQTRQLQAMGWASLGYKPEMPAC